MIKDFLWFDLRSQTLNLSLLVNIKHLWFCFIEMPSANFTSLSDTS